MVLTEREKASKGGRREGGKKGWRGGEGVAHDRPKNGNTEINFSFFKVLKEYMMYFLSFLI